MPLRSRVLLNAASRLDDLLRDTIGRRYYPNCILPCILMRRLECLLEPTRDPVCEAFERGGTDAALLMKVAGYRFYNTSPYDFPRICSATGELRTTMSSYLAGWSPNIRELLLPFHFEEMLERLDEGNLLSLLVRQIADLDLHPACVASQEMSDLFEELLRRCFGSASYQGEYFTPPEVARLMARLVMTGESDPELPREKSWTAYDPCCGTGRLLVAFQEYAQERNPEMRVELYGQEQNPQSLALCKTDLYMRNRPDDAERMAQGSTLSDDRHATMRYHRILANPPFGTSWSLDRASIAAEAKRGDRGRFAAGTPRGSDGQLLFLQHVLGRMKPAEQGGSRIALLTNGSPLFNGDADSGESAIRRWILENDWIEALIALPESLFYNTGIGTYLWLLTNTKSQRRLGKAQFIDARHLWTPMRRAVGEKHRELSEDQCSQVVSLYRAFEENEESKVYPNAAFGYRRVVVEHPLRLAFQVTPERIAAACAQPTIAALVRKSVGQRQRNAPPPPGLHAFLESLPTRTYRNRDAWVRDLEGAAHATEFPLPARLRDALLKAFSHRDEEADVCCDTNGQPLPDPKLRDTERVPLTEDIWEFFAREVQPSVPDAWIDSQVRDEKDHKVGKVGYELSFTRRFYRFQKHRPLEEIMAEIMVLEAEMTRLQSDALRNT